MMRIISLNANGIRSAERKGVFPWLVSQKPDVVCIQETKAQVGQLSGAHIPDGYHAFYCDAEKKGYSGVAVYCRQQPLNVTWGIGDTHFDSEGRYLQVDFPNVSVASIYVPSGSAKEERQVYKLEVLDWLLPRMIELRSAGKELILCGDFNIAHTELDLKNWRGNRKNSGFLPEERAWLTKVFEESGFVDTFRALKPGEEHYTWWSNRGRAWDNNVGWRIDYQIATPAVAASAQDASIYREERFSDHAPLTIDYDWSLS